jgi:hypothetical protein
VLAFVLPHRFTQDIYISLQMLQLFPRTSHVCDRFGRPRRPLELGRLCSQLFVGCPHLLFCLFLCSHHLLSLGCHPNMQAFLLFSLVFGMAKPVINLWAQGILFRFRTSLRGRDAVKAMAISLELLELLSSLDEKVVSLHRISILGADIASGPTT